jgi:hypothetical protein
VAHDVRIEVRSDNDLTVTVDGPKPPPVPSEIIADAGLPEKPSWVACAVAGLLGAGGLLIAFHAIALPDWPSATAWSVIGLLVAVALLGHVIVELGSAFTLWATGGDPSLRANLRNPAAFVGLVERPLLVGALAFQQPGFFLVWYAYKAIGRWKEGQAGVNGREKFVTHLLHTGLSLGAVALAWVVWQLLDLPLR